MKKQSVFKVGLLSNKRIYYTLYDYQIYFLQNKTFEHLFLHLLDKKLITLGLYRLKGAVDNDHAFVYTNPKFDAIITHRDRAFVLGFDIPDDL